MRILISGLGGAMGRETARLALAGCRGAELIGGVSRSGCADFGVPCATDFAGAPTAADCVIDFSHHSVTYELLRFVKQNRLPLVLATTGQSEAERAAILAAATELPLFFSANCSTGVALLIELAKKATAALPDAEIEIIERHHDRKLDAPSGTALALAEALRGVRPDAEIVAGRSGHGKRAPNEIGIHAVRLGSVVGTHEVILGTAYQTLTLRHEAHSRALFAEGALAAAAFLQGRRAGLYGMEDMIQW